MRFKRNLKGKTNRFIGGAIGGGLAEATFVGDSTLSSKVCFD